jgi:hypothetical protein
LFIVFLFDGLVRSVIMQQFIRYGLFFWLLVLLSACSAPAEISPTPAAVTPLPMNDALPLTGDQIEPGSYVIPAPIGANQAREVLAEIYQVNIEDIAVVDVERTTFPDSCLGVKVEREVCTEEELPGYVVTLQFNGMTHILHTTQDGNLVRIASIRPTP